MERRRGAAYLAVLLALCLAGWSNASKAIADSSPVLALSLDEGEGPLALDASANHNDGDVAGAAWAAGRFGAALEFDGEDDWVTVADSPSLDLSSEVTVEAWVRPSTSDAA
ncbi:MAG TPA: hypothetical protein VN238_05530, partial [Solirubrobacteraceae bacterium]|nr:hypothetical protein [Solirubrobacteraceae bacterium]